MAMALCTTTKIVQNQIYLELPDIPKYKESVNSIGKYQKTDLVIGKNSKIAENI